MMPVKVGQISSPSITEIVDQQNYGCVMAGSMFKISAAQTTSQGMSQHNNPTKMT